MSKKSKKKIKVALFKANGKFGFCDAESKTHSLFTAQRTLKSYKTLKLSNKEYTAFKKEYNNNEINVDILSNKKGDFTIAMTNEERLYLDELYDMIITEIMYLDDTLTSDDSNISDEHKVMINELTHYITHNSGSINTIKLFSNECIDLY